MTDCSIVYTIKVEISLWDALKLRLAGAKISDIKQVIGEEEGDIK